MNEIREYIQEQIKFLSDNFDGTSRIAVAFVLINLKHLLKMVELEESLFEIQETPELKIGETWLVKIGKHIMLEKFYISEIKNNVVRMPSGLKQTESWYKISDIEWVERIEE